MPDGPTLDVRISLRRREIHLSIDESFGPGFSALVGPSGIGKSSLVAAIAGVLTPDAGRIALGAAVWFDRARGIDVPAHARRVGVVFQGLALFPHLTVAENVGYGVPRALPREVRARRVAEALATTRAEHLAARRTRTLSGGEAQRVAIARALATDASVLLLDEPLAALDEALRAELLAMLRARVASRPVPVVYVTHRLDEAEALGARVVRLAG